MPMEEHDLPPFVPSCNWPVITSPLIGRFGVQSDSKTGQMEGGGGVAL